MSNPNPLGYGETPLQTAASNLERITRHSADSLESAARILDRPELAETAADMRARADELATAIAESRVPVTPALPPLTRRHKRVAAALTAWLCWATLAPLVALALLAIVLLTGCAAGGSSPTPQTSGPDPTPVQTCREAARDAFTRLIQDEPTVTPDEAQEIVDDGCSDVTPADRAVIVDAERTAASARYLDTQAP